MLELLGPLVTVPQEPTDRNSLLSHDCDEGDHVLRSAGSQPIEGHEHVRVPENRGRRRQVAGFSRVLPANAKTARSVSLAAFVAEAWDAGQAGCLEVAGGAGFGIRHCTIDRISARHSAGTASAVPYPGPQVYASGSAPRVC